MERLTIKYEGLFVPKKTCTIDRFGEADDCDSCDSVCESDCENCAVQECFTRLGEYEDTGLTPEQIREIDRLYAEKCREVAELRQRDTAKEPQYEGDGYHDGDLICDTWICPNCGERYEVEYDIYDFCPKCGQKILWRKADVQESEQTLEKLSAYICDELCCHRNVGADKGDCEMQEICERCELGGCLDEIRKCLSCENSSEITRSSRDNGGWIPVEEKPTEDGFYVATMSGALVDLAEPFVGLAEFEDGEWVDGDDVIAWMPLPEPERLNRAKR